jgi:hypothetical protein
VTDRRRELPSVDRLLLEPEIRVLLDSAPRIAVVDAVRESIAAARSRRAGPPESWAADVRERLCEHGRSSLRPLLNATGVVLHTNLGRAPLAPEAVVAMAAVAAGYSNLEFDLDTGIRGSRSDHCREPLRAATGAEDALAVNNAAGALLLALGALAAGRIAPDIMAGNIIGVIGQRLVRKLCVHCKLEYGPSRYERQILHLGVGSEAPPVFQAAGCAQCEHTGYKGRLALMELLRFDAELDELVARRATFRDLLKTARAKGYRTLADDGVRRVLEGVTSMDEIGRVLDLTAGIQ